MKYTLQWAALVIGASAMILVEVPSAYAQPRPSESAPVAGTSIEGKTEVEKAIGRCVAAVVGGALLGALLGGRRNAGSGAVIGGAVGAGVCAIMLSMASAQDKARLRQIQLEALNSGQPQTDQWQTTEGRYVTATVTPSNFVQVTAPKTETPVKCTRMITQLSASGQGSPSSELRCLSGDTWVPPEELGIKPSDLNV